MAGPAKEVAKQGMQAMRRVVHFTNIPLRMAKPDRPVPPEGLKEVVFKTEPWVNKTEIKRVLNEVYGVGVEKVHTYVRMGKKKRKPGKAQFYRKKSVKKAWVLLKSPWHPPPTADALVYPGKPRTLETKEEYSERVKQEEEQKQQKLREQKEEQRRYWSLPSIFGGR